MWRLQASALTKAAFKYHLVQTVGQAETAKLFKSYDSCLNVAYGVCPIAGIREGAEAGAMQTATAVSKPHKEPSSLQGEAALLFSEAAGPGCGPQAWRPGAAEEVEQPGSDEAEEAEQMLKQLKGL